MSQEHSGTISPWWVSGTSWQPPFTLRPTASWSAITRVSSGTSNQVPYELPSDLEAAIAAFVTYYNYSRYHIALNNVTPADVLNGRREQILERRKEMQLQTIDKRRRYNRTVKELSAGSP